MPRFLALCLLPLPVLAQDASLGAAGTGPAEWLGAAPHIVLVGTLDGHLVDVRILDADVAEGVALFAGKREYLPGEAGWRYGDFEVALRAVIDGVEKSFEIEVENRDFSRHPAPATFALVGENFPDGAQAFLEASAEWETAEDTVNAELGGWTGTLAIAQDDGTPDAEGLVGDGLIGGHMLAERGEDRLALSFTVPVTEVEKDD